MCSSLTICTVVPNWLESLPRLATLAAANWILHAEIQHHHANVLRRPSAEGAGNGAVVCIVTAAFLPAVLGMFAHGDFSRCAQFIRTDLRLQQGRTTSIGDVSSLHLV